MEQTLDYSETQVLWGSKSCIIAVRAWDLKDERETWIAAGNPYWRVDSIVGMNPIIRHGRPHLELGFTPRGYQDYEPGTRQGTRLDLRNCPNLQVWYGHVRSETSRPGDVLEFWRSQVPTFLPQEQMISDVTYNWMWISMSADLSKATWEGVGTPRDLPEESQRVLHLLGTKERRIECFSIWNHDTQFREIQDYKYMCNSLDRPFPADDAEQPEPEEAKDQTSLEETTTKTTEPPKRKSIFDRAAEAVAEQEKAGTLIKRPGRGGHMGDHEARVKQQKRKRHPPNTRENGEASDFADRAAKSARVLEKSAPARQIPRETSDTQRPEVTAKGPVCDKNAKKKAREAEKERDREASVNGEKAVRDMLRSLAGMEDRVEGGDKTVLGGLLDEVMERVKAAREVVNKMPVPKEVIELDD